MKRSEMLDTIIWYMEANHPIASKKDMVWVAKEILTAIERKGMLPPKSSEGCIDDWGNEIEGPQYEWEPE